jgi:hypothetical protein
MGKLFSGDYGEMLIAKTMTGDTRLSEALDSDSSILEYIVSLNPHDPSGGT